MDTLAERIKAVRKHTGKLQTEFGAVFGVKEATVTSWETGARKPSDAVLISICREFGVNEQWLRTGEGEMFLDLGPDAQLEKIFDQIQLSGDDTIRAIIRTYWGLSDQDKAVIRRVILELADQIKKGQGESPGQ